MHDYVSNPNGQKMHYVAGPDAIKLDAVLRQKGYEWLAKEGGAPFVKSDQKYVDWFYTNFRLDLSPTFKGVRRSTHVEDVKKFKFLLPVYVYT